MKTIDFKDLGELVLDESFRKFVQHTDRDSVAMWKEYIITHPEKKDTLETGISIVRTLLNARKADLTMDKEKSLRELLRRIDEERPESDKNHNYISSVWFRIASVILLVVGLTTLWNIFHTWRDSKQALSMNEIVVPLGEKAQIILPDGTHVWINSASKLRYPVMFGKVSRDVTLEGEAYFDVSKKQGKTFVVNTRDAKVNVLGTAFNVKCYPDDEKTQTTVVRGMVRVEVRRGNHGTLIIKPNEMATLQERPVPGKITSKTTSITVNRVDPENMVSWKDQMLVFTGESFEDLAKKMERWFNVNIKIDNEELKTQRYNGKFVHNETVYQVLEAIKITTPITYEVYKDTIFISKN